MPRVPLKPLLDRPIPGALVRALAIALALALVSAAASAAWGQAGPAAGEKPVQRYQPVRLIVDRATGIDWLLERDMADRGAPGRLKKINLAGHAVAALGARAMLAAVVPPVIRAGDRVVIVEETPVVDARLEAVALGPARRRQCFQARIVLGGGIVEAMAVDAGRARLLSARSPQHAMWGAGQ